ncbi:MAG: 3-deoxy-manno-octulosonate cytidylyltransferase [Bacteroidetes bacterium]|nr:3-deoxy-manno-octulosonate cytidylyltransferase [Bacteroidota bacterium]
MKILAVIPARYASTRLPGKPLADILGKPMIQWVYEAVTGCRDIAEVIVATDDQRIYDAVVNFGGHCEMTKESHLNGTSRCSEVAERNAGFDYILNVQGDEPLINPDDLLQITQILDGKCTIASAYRNLKKEEEVMDPSIVKVVLDKNKRAMYFSRSVVPYNRTQSSIDYYGHIGLYAFKTEILKELCELEPGKLEMAESLEQLRWLENGYEIQLEEVNEQAPAVDTPEGLEIVRALMKARLQS